MKKSYTIGRDSQNDIVIPDPSDLVSRLHATLKVDDRGHYKIMDQSTNGTYVNGIRVEKFAEVPVTRKDEISFASVATLDWDEVPRSRRGSIWLKVLLPLIGLAIIGLLVYLIIDKDPFNKNKGTGRQGELIEERIDTFKVIIPERTLLKWNTSELKVEIQGNVKWVATISDKDGNEVKGASVEPSSGEGNKTIIVKLPHNTSNKHEAVYRITVKTEAKVQTQSYSFQIVMDKRPQSDPVTKPEPEPEPNPAIL